MAVLVTGGAGYIGSHTVVLLQEAGHGCQAYNLGTGVGYSVLDVINTFASVNGCDVPYEVVERRPGDVAECYADSSYSGDKLNWKAENGLAEMVRDHWKWQKLNPNGYRQSGYETK